jgi:hypothetical protein
MSKPCGQKMPLHAGQTKIDETPVMRACEQQVVDPLALVSCQGFLRCFCLDDGAATKQHVDEVVLHIVTVGDPNANLSLSGHATLRASPCQFLFVNELVQQAPELIVDRH